MRHWRLLSILAVALRFAAPAQLYALQSAACKPPISVTAAQAELWLVTLDGGECANATCAGQACSLIESIGSDLKKVAPALTQISNETNALAHEHPRFQRDRRVLLGRIDEALQRLREYENQYDVLARRLRPQNAADRAPYTMSPVLIPDTWVRSELLLFEAERGEIDLGAYFANCDTNCGPELAVAADLLRTTHLVRRALVPVVAPWHEAFVVQVNSTIAQWRQFAEANRGQTPWELALNGWFFDISREFRPPPDKQLLFLHPEPVGFGRMSDGQQLSPRLAMSLLGLRAWSWRSDGEALNAAEPAPVSLRYGFSTLVVLGNESEPKFSWGANMHVSHGTWIGYALGKRGGKRQHFIVASGDAMKLFGERSRVLRKFIKK